jgi:hypothetical protein
MAENHRFGRLSALRAQRKRHTKPIHCEKRWGCLTAPGGPARWVAEVLKPTPTVASVLMFT